MTKPTSGELPIVQKTYDLIKWYVPILNRLPRDHRFGLGDRMVLVLYDLLEGFVAAPSFAAPSFPSSSLGMPQRKLQLPISPEEGKLELPKTVTKPELGNQYSAFS